MTSKVITGIGSRSTPQLILGKMRDIGEWCRKNNIFVRSGHADGADWAFEAGAQEKCIAYLPWKSFNKDLISKAALCDVSREKEMFRAYDQLVDEFHPAPGRLTRGARLLMRRNCCQILGLTLEHPTQAVICWTDQGGLRGGTAFAMRIAVSRDIPIINMWDVDNYDTVIDFIKEMTGG